MQIQDHHQLPELDHRSPPPTIGGSFGETVPPVFRGIASNWGRFKRHFWGVLIRQRQGEDFGIPEIARTALLALAGQFASLAEAVCRLRLQDPRQRARKLVTKVIHWQCESNSAGSVKGTRLETSAEVA